MELITRTIAKHLIDTGAVRRVSIKSTNGVYLLVLDTPLKDYTLRESKGTGPRFFKTVAGAVSVVEALNIRYFDVDLGQQAPGQRSLM